MSAIRDGGVIVYDVGGSHVSASVCFADSYRLGPVFSAPHLEQLSSDAFLALLLTLGRKAADGSNTVNGAELAFPGPFDFAAGISRMVHKLPYLYGVDLRGQLAEKLGVAPSSIRFLLDSSAFLLGELYGGVAKSERRAVGITLGTGVGSAAALAGEIVSEGHQLPPSGEIWNLPYEGGIVEDFVSARAIRANYQKRTGLHREVVDLAERAPNDAAAAAAFEYLGRHLGRALRLAFAGFDPDVIVLGGRIALSADLFMSAAHHEMKGMKAELRASMLKDKAALVGAGVAWFNAPTEPSPR